MFGGHGLQQTVNCSPSRRLVPLFVRDRLHAETSEEKREEASPNLLPFHAPLYRRIILSDFTDRIYPIEL